MMVWVTSHGPPMSNKILKCIFFEALPAQICFIITQIIHQYGPNYLWNSEASPCRKSFKKIDLNLLLFDVGDPCSLLMAGAHSNFKLWPIFHTIYLIPALNLRPGLNSMAFFTYIIKFSAFKLVSFMVYTYNIQGLWDNTRQQPPFAQPHDGHLMTAPQPHVNSHFVYI